MPRTPKPEEERSKSLSKTYHTIKDMISSRFGPSRKDTDPDPEVSLNNVTEELRKSSHNIDEDESKKKESTYSKPRAQDPPPINMQHYPKNTYQQYGHSYYQSPQQNVPGMIILRVEGSGRFLIELSLKMKYINYYKIEGNVRFTPFQY